MAKGEDKKRKYPALNIKPSVPTCGRSVCLMSIRETTKVKQNPAPTRKLRSEGPVTPIKRTDATSATAQEAAEYLTREPKNEKTGAQKRSTSTVAKQTSTKNKKKPPVKKVSKRSEEESVEEETPASKKTATEIAAKKKAVKDGSQRHRKSVRDFPVFKGETREEINMFQNVSRSSIMHLIRSDGFCERTSSRIYQLFEEKRQFQEIGDHITRDSLEANIKRGHALIKLHLVITENGQNSPPNVKSLASKISQIGHDADMQLMKLVENLDVSFHVVMTDMSKVYDLSGNFPETIGHDASREEKEVNTKSRISFVGTGRPLQIFAFDRRVEWGHVALFTPAEHKAENSSGKMNKSLKQQLRDVPSFNRLDTTRIISAYLQCEKVLVASTRRMGEWMCRYSGQVGKDFNAMSVKNPKSISKCAEYILQNDEKVGYAFQDRYKTSIGLKDLKDEDLAIYNEVMKSGTHVAHVILLLMRIYQVRGHWDVLTHEFSTDGAFVLQGHDKVKFYGMSPQEFRGCTLMSNEKEEDRQDRYVWSQAIVYCLKNSKQAETSDEDSEEEYSDFSAGELVEEQREAQMFEPILDIEVIHMAFCEEFRSLDIEELREKLKERGLDVDGSKSELADRLVHALLMTTARLSANFLRLSSLSLTPRSMERIHDV
ncbi:hypothetical protein PROFUN_07603 [Planoprotostelium fungivorum]|uniref:SAP domain-containing protein n=1 Tax=Planoprotostelium fungivorum TaxID=1890364 RepID=A0A2P6NK37_9EUKA|nr:hypothetical protein PROFUN_07603 [Planoprotostelium fungivorum]